MEVLNLQGCAGQQDGDLDLGGISRVIGIEQMAEVERPRRSCSCSLKGAIPLSLLGPSPVESPVLPKDVRSELAAGQVWDQVSPVYR